MFWPFSRSTQLQPGDAFTFVVPDLMDYMPALRCALFPDADPRQPAFGLWLLFAPSFHAEVAIGFEGSEQEGVVWMRTARLSLWHFSQSGPHPDEVSRLLESKCLPPRLWTAQASLSGRRWSEAVGTLRGSEAVWRTKSDVGQLDGCAAEAVYFVDQRRTECFPELGSPLCTEAESLCFRALTSASSALAGPETSPLLRQVRGYFANRPEP